MTATALDSAIFRDIFSTADMRHVFSDEARTGYYLEIEAALARAQARLGIIPEKAATEIVRQCRIENIDLARLKQQTERIGYPILGVVQQIVGLCADGLGEWCHWGATTQDITDTAAILQIRAALDLVEKDMEAIAAALADLSRRHRDTPMAGPQQPAAGGAAHLRLQDGGAACRHAAPPRTARAAAPARAGRRVRRRGRHARLARRRRPQGAGRADEGARPRPAGDRLAHRARPHRRGRLLPRPRHRHARQDLHGREAVDADRGGRGLRALPRGARLVEHHAAEAQPDLLPLHPFDRRAGAPARRRAARSRGRRPRALDRAVGDRMDLAAGDLPARRRAR